MSRILVTGGTGFLGELLIEKLLEANPEDTVVTVARNEGKLVSLKEKFPSLITITGDVADRWTARKAMEAVSQVYHLAAFKHVGMAEEDVFQCINSNVVGTINILAESYRVKPDFVVGISTDKAAQVSGVYGATKLLMERLFQEAERMNHETNYRIVRYGNVLYSTGSVLCKWREKLSQGKDIIVTEPSATRFFWTRTEAIQHIFQCLSNSKDATPFIPQMKAMRIEDLMNAMLQKYTIPGSNVQVKYIGLQPGENLHETIDGVTFSNEVPQYSVKEITETYKNYKRQQIYSVCSCHKPSIYGYVWKKELKC